MYKRSELRHACFRAKNNNATESNKELLAVVEPLLAIGQRWENFSVEWDLLVAKDGTVKIIKPETDLEFIKTVCMEKAFCVKYGKEENWDDRDQNVITIVEGVMLDKLMTWDNYSKAWGVDVDIALKLIVTKLFRQSTQKEVTEEMIQASRISNDDAPYVGETPNEVEFDVKELSPEEFKKFAQLVKDAKQG